MLTIKYFVDMDGVLAEHDKDIEDKMYDKDFFLHRPVNNGAKKLVKKLKKNQRDLMGLNVELNILSKAPDNGYAKEEKIAWINKHFPNTFNNIYIVPSGTSKADYVREKGLEATFNYLFDDYTPNLVAWEIASSNNIGIKILNGTNGSGKIWDQKKKHIIALSEL